MPLTEGARIGPYQIVSLLGRGGMGEVYRAHDARLQRDVAIKVLSPALSDTPDAVARFEREARAVAALNHPNIVSLHDVGHEGAIAYAVTELLEGETLRGLLGRTTPVPLHQALDIATQVARGVGAAHARGIVHRDLKPENLFLTTDRRVKVLDFGLAARRQAIPGVETVVETLPGVVMGTIGYMAPEVVRGDPATTASDVFGFGVVLYEMLAGVHPFARATPAETLTAILRDDPPRLGRVAPGTPVPVARLVERCLQKAPGDRPESMRDVAFYLENVDASSGAVPASGDAVADGAAAPTHGARRGTLITTGAAVMAMVAITLGLLAWLHPGGGATAAGDGLSRVPAVVARAQHERLERLHLAAQVIASQSALKAVIETRDALTATDFLEGAQASLPGRPILVALTSDGRMLARSGGSAADGATESAEWQRVRDREASDGLVTVAGRPHHAAAAPASAAGTTFGTVIAALPLDDGFARDLRQIAEHDVVLLDETGIRGSTVLPGAIPWRSLGAWRAAGGRADVSVPVTVGTQASRAREVPLSTSPAVSAVVISSRAADDDPRMGVRLGVVIAGILVLAVTAAVQRLAHRS